MSTPILRAKSLSTIIYPKEMPGKTGQQAGETGLSEPLVTTPTAALASRLEWTKEGRVILSASTRRWLEETKAAFKDMLMSQDYALLQRSDWLQEALTSIEFDIRGMIRLQHPPSDEEILSTLNAMAETFQVEVPEAVGLELYMAALRTLPRPAFVRARDVLVLQHKWPRLPYPADFIEHGDEVKERMKSVERKLRYQRNVIIRALKIMRNRTF